jgi:hypothetical protein
MVNQKHLPLRAAATASGRSYWRLRAAIQSGDLRATQFTKGGKYYIRPEDLEAYFDAHTVSPLSEKAVGQ